MQACSAAAGSAPKQNRSVHNLEILVANRICSATSLDAVSRVSSVADALGSHVCSTYLPLIGCSQPAPRQSAEFQRSGRPKPTPKI